VTERNLEKAAHYGEPSLVWREGQERRLRIVLEAAGPRAGGTVLDDGCGMGLYLERMAPGAAQAFGVEVDRERATAAGLRLTPVGGSAACARSEALPFPSSAFDLILSHEVLEHVVDDRSAVCEIVRVLKEGGRLVLFVPNRGYPFETHGIYWRGQYRFGNVPFVNYLPRRLRDRLAPHVRAYTKGQLARLFAGLPLRPIRQAVLFGAYDNWIARWPLPGRILRRLLQSLERTPLRLFGLSHLWVLEKQAGPIGVAGPSQGNASWLSMTRVQ
jgi:SAM-dependent methyltransferase